MKQSRMPLQQKQRKEKRQPDTPTCRQGTNKRQASTGNNNNIRKQQT